MSSTLRISIIVAVHSVPYKTHQRTVFATGHFVKRRIRPLVFRITKNEGIQWHNKTQLEMSIVGDNTS